MQKYKFNAAAVSCRRVGSFGVVEAEYSGPVGDVAFDYLRSCVLAAAKDTPALVLRMERALLMITEFLPRPRSTYEPNVVPGALVVPADQFEIYSGYARQLASEGITRVVFLESQLKLAYLWAERRSRPRA